MSVYIVPNVWEGFTVVFILLLVGKTSSVCQWSKPSQLLARELRLGPGQRNHRRDHIILHICCLSSGRLQRTVSWSCVFPDGD